MFILSKTELKYERLGIKIHEVKWKIVSALFGSQYWIVFFWCLIGLLYTNNNYIRSSCTCHWALSRCRWSPSPGTPPHGSPPWSSWQWLSTTRTTPGHWRGSRPGKQRVSGRVTRVIISGVWKGGHLTSTSCSCSNWGGLAGLGGSRTRAKGNFDSGCQLFSKASWISSSRTSVTKAL